jgi:hypothetical protein
LTPTCGYSADGTGYKIYPNQCLACADAKVYTTTPGKCQGVVAPGVCSSLSIALFCINSYIPVCGYDVYGAQVATYNNACWACKVSNVVSWKQGVCPP